MKKLFFKRLIMKLAIPITVFIITALSLQFSCPNANAGDFPINTPLWAGPYDIFINPELNIAYPDTGAVYWSAKITIPEGAELELVGKYAHARYISINSYDMDTGAPTDALNDTEIIPDIGSENPFLPGAKRFGNRNRDFTILVLNELPPEDPAQRMPNTLYAKAGDEGKLALAWRIYVPDFFRNITGGVGLPEPRVTLADGTVLDTEASYDALSIDPTTFSPIFLDAQTYYALREGLVLQQYGWPYPIPETFPAQNPPVFKKVFSVNENVMCNFVKQFLGMCDPAPDYQVGQYANLDNQYMSVLVNRGHGELVVIHGKAPVTPKTYWRRPFMQENVDMRYWSITTNESIATTKVADGMYDEQAPLDRNGYYTIVVSLPEDQPRNAKRRNRVKWISWPENGDGAGHLDDANLIVRHMLPSSDFEHAIQNVMYPGDEAEVLGPYMPVCQYMSIEEFEALGHRPWKNLD